MSKIGTPGTGQWRQSTKVKYDKPVSAELAAKLCPIRHDFLVICVQTIAVLQEKKDKSRQDLI